MAAAYPNIYNWIIMMLRSNPLNNLKKEEQEQSLA